MRLKKLLVIAAWACGILNGWAQTTTTTTHTYWNERFRYDRESATLFNPNELSMDLFGTWADRDRFGGAPRPRHAQCCRAMQEGSTASIP